ncbi:MAG TPA: SBBP repeat-containing protein, partial [Candidatus Binatia bacterium]|nr:SBBP repeat-containing protein [Candidatus Binatia bacterium]
MPSLNRTLLSASGLGLVIVFAIVLLSGNAQRPQASLAKPADSAAKAEALAGFRRLPISFEANSGQTDGRVKFLSRGAGYVLFLTSSGAVMELQAPSAEAPQPKPAGTGELAMPYTGRGAPGAKGSRGSSRVSVLEMQLARANQSAPIAALDRQQNTSNYFIGNDHSRWRTGVPNFARVRYSQIYPGVDLVFYGNRQQLEYDFIVSAGADPGAIGLRFRNDGKAGAVSVAANGDLVAHLPGGDLPFHKPVVYQLDRNRNRQLIDGGYVLRADGEVSFALGAYDHSRELVIDPTIAYATYLGGSKADTGMGVAVDCCGSAFIAGSTLSTDFPTTGPPLQGTNAGGSDVFITKYDALGGTEQYSTYVGGSGNDVATDIVLDDLGDMTVTGYTLSTDFPLELPIQSKFGGGSVTGDAFLFQIASHGTALVYSTYFGGSSDDEGMSLALDSANSVYLVGYTSSTNFPIVPGSFKTSCGLTSAGKCANGFVLKVNVPPGQFQQTSLVYSSYLGGSGGLGDSAYGVWVDNTTSPAPGYAYVVGITGSPNFPVTSGAFDQLCGTDGKCNGTYDGFVSEINPQGKGLVFSTFLGGSAYDYAAGVAVDSTGVYVSGNTTSTNFPVTASAVQRTFGGMSSGCVPSSTKTCGDVTLTKLNPAGSALLYSTYLGGSLDENPGLSLALDAGGSVYVTGQTDSTNFPVVTPVDQAVKNGTYNGGTYGGGASDAFITKLNPQGNSFAYSTYVGGSSADSGSRIILDQFTSAYIAGTTTSTNFPVTAGAAQTTCGTNGSCNGGLSDAFGFKLETSADLNIAMSGPKTITSGSNITYAITTGNTGPDGASVVSIT